MRQSNAYVIGFAAILTVIIGGLLAAAAVGLREPQQKAVKLDTRTKILSAVMEIKEGDDVNQIWEERISSLVVDIDGDVVERLDDGTAVIAESIDVGKEFKKSPQERLFPVFEFKGDNGEIQNYIIPVYGNGLWDRIWGFVALEKDLVTIKGVRFDHKGETPGLGARITDGEVQDRYIGKKIYNNVGDLVSVQMMKAETGDASIYDEYHVDGMSGSTMTANGVNDMLMRYFRYYSNYFKTIDSADQDEIRKAEQVDEVIEDQQPMKENVQTEEVQ
ncbi:NADH:ubiquinone reductase (Na(+)-transporting) subunit C [Cesiribacter andamanensis]|uniref:Na(+)-translocating NADH-quinone reductase subunit C n=1 Tax=Cesiribacter andamanensis AMV16 TaxID=1279009 RepID=M7NT82_9BACT|nr:NADH:ubiquinone reductase (Na(+)-transporting) subunit C [Cesiribacter andamanensis]EMR01689.1 Na(+)-translocating NADH-quinone reductase subunit C [Cesiribacter andamanensis AMV16]